MIYKKYVKKISDSLAKYKKVVDSLETEYKVEKAKLEAKLTEMSGKWVPEYIESYRKENLPDLAFKARLTQARDSVEPEILHYLEALQKTLNNFFNAPVRSDFANKIMSIQMSGLQLLDLEFGILQDSASTYLERRLLNQLAESRTAKKGEDISNPYLRVEVPDIDLTYRAFDSFKQSARGLLYSYSGQNAELVHLLENEIPNYVSVSMDSYFRNDKESEFLRVMDKANSILPESKIKRTLTENDKRFIDLLVDSRYPSLAKTRVVELAEADADIALLLSLDERYSKYLETE